MMEEFLINKIEEITFTEVTVDEGLWTSGILDSITIVELAVEIEDEYSIKVPFDDIVEDNFETVSRLIAYIERKKNA